MIIEEFWNIITNFFTSVNSIISTFLAITLALLVERIANELGHRNADLFKTNPDKPLVRMANYFIRLVLAFFIGFAFFFVVFATVSILSAIVGFFLNLT